MNRILAIAGADTAERMRRFSFLLMVVATLYAGYLFVPDAHAGYGTIVMDGHRGLYTSAYMGTAIAVLIGTWMSLIGFFLVRGSVERDAELGVGDIVAASPVRRLSFLLGKFGSNLALLVAIAIISYAAAMAMQLIRGEDRHIDLLAYVVPFVIITLPGMAFIAAVTVVADVVRWLRGFLGGVFFLAIWIASLTIPFTAMGYTRIISPFDVQGSAGAVIALRNQAATQYQHMKLDDVQIGGGAVKRSLTTYRFDGIPWSWTLITQRLMWLLISLGLVIGVAPFFDRFARESSAVRASRFNPDLAKVIPNIAILRVFRAEFALLTNGAGFWWMLIAVGLAVACGVAPLTTVTEFILPVAMIWPIERFSSLGSRESRWNVGEILGVTPGYIVRTPLAQIAAATLLGSLICAGYLIRLLIVGEPAAFVATILVVAATAALALALGVLSRSSRLFEALYLIAWYIGPINHASFIDFAGVTLRLPMLAIGISALLIAAAYATTIAARRLTTA